MPVYVYTCNCCGATGDRYRTVAERNDAQWCEHCDRGMMKRVFIPTAQIAVPAHFGMPMGWNLPDKGDTAGWEARQGGSTAHAPRQESFKEYFEKTVKSFD